MPAPTRPACVRSYRVVPAACLVALLALVGCSGDSKDDDAVGATSSTSVIAPGTTVRPVDTSFTGEGSGEFCQLITTFTAGSQDLTPGATPAELETSLNDALVAIDQAEAVAPGEIKGDVVAIAAAFDTLVTNMAAVDYDIDRVDASVLTALQSEGFLTAVTRLQAYLTSICRTG